MYAFQEHFVLVLSHDEVVHGKNSLINKMPGDEGSSPTCGCFTPGCSPILAEAAFHGGQFGQWREWNHDTSLDWDLTFLPRHDGLRRLVQHLNHVYRSEPALWDLDDTLKALSGSIFTMPTNAWSRSCGVHQRGWLLISPSTRRRSCATTIG